MFKRTQKKAPARLGGQAAVELAIFGAILIFILAAIVRSAVGNGYAQNQNFTAMRMAMLASWQGSEAHPGPGVAQNVSHNSAQVLFIEDRLSTEFGKYGDLDRTPYLAQGSGTFSYNLFYPVDSGEIGANVPIMDVYINGQHFPFTTAIYTSTTLSPPVTCQQYTAGSCLQRQCLRNQREWVDGRKLFYTPIANGEPAFSTAPPADCSARDNALCSSLTVTDTFGASYTNSTGDMQYDLQRLGDYSTTTGVESPSQFPVGNSLRGDIAWQWAATWGTDAASIGLDAANQKYPSYDIDGRLKTVTIYNISSTTDSVNVFYVDYNAGDIDTSWDLNSCGPKPGLLNNTELFTFTKEGTYLKILEGKLYNPETGEYVRSRSKRDTIDLIQRIVQLSNNTGRFCSGASPLSTVANDGVTPNPVEVCIPVGSPDNCFNNQVNFKSTCFDQTNNRLFIRSRLEDLRGHSWFTATSGQLNVH